MSVPAKERSISYLTDVDAAWVAGLLEGEGSFLGFVRDGRRRLRVGLVSTDLDVIDKVGRIVGGGNRTESTRTGRKRCYHWGVDRRNDAIALMLRLYPLMGKRRQDQIVRALAVVGIDPVAGDGASS